MNTPDYIYFILDTQGNVAKQYMKSSPAKSFMTREKNFLKEHPGDPTRYILYRLPVDPEALEQIDSTLPKSAGKL